MKPIFIALVLLECCLSESAEPPTTLRGGGASSSFTFNLLPPVAPQDERIDLHREEVYLHEDQTYEMTLTQEKTILTPKGLLSDQTLSSPSYFPGEAEVQLVEAYTLQPSGKRIDVPKENLFTTTSPADPAAPGFVTSLQLHVAFPHLKIGSKLHVKWLFKQITPPPFKFADTLSPFFDRDTLRTEMVVNLPATMPAEWAKEGAFEVTDAVTGGRRIITGVLGPQPRHRWEPFMVAPADFLPFMQVSTIPSWEEIGNTFSALSTPSQVVTPAIEKLAAAIVGKKTGKEAAVALYNWVAGNIAYLETAIDTRQGLAPPKASQVIANRFGDCKGHSCVLQTLLKVVGIESFPVLINWDNAFEQYPLPIPNFDHEMVFIPSLNLFLNPTDQYSTFEASLEETNFVSEGTQVLAHKPVLIVKPTGSLLTKTPPAAPEDNQYLVINQMELDLQGNMQTRGNLKASGCFSDLVRSSLADVDSLNGFIAHLMLRNGVQGDVLATSTAPDNLAESMKIEYVWEGAEVVQRFQEELIFQVPIAVDFCSPHFFLQYLSPTHARTYPIIMGAAIYQWVDQIQLPLGYTMLKMPGDVTIENSAGTYKASYQLSNRGLLTLRRELRIHHNVYPPDAYDDLSALLQESLRDRKTVLSCGPTPAQ